jgi:hypothetical protein
MAMLYSPSNVSKSLPAKPLSQINRMCSCSGVTAASTSSIAAGHFAFADLRAG